MTGSDHVALIELSSGNGLDGRVAGQKASSLVRLAAAGMPVPTGVVVPVDASDGDLDRLAADIAARFPASMLAVRSSGVAEDLQGASFAGQYETVLNVPARASDIAAALRRVRASVESAHVVAYRPTVDRRMAVLVMPMVDADAAGIAFTRDPVSGEECVLVEAVRGVADRLAAGETAGERWRIGPDAERVMDLRILTAEQAVAVADLARRVESLEGTPQDIEWAISGGELMLLQARPMTGLDLQPIPYDDEVPPGPWEWDSTHSRMPMTPLTVSGFAPAFERGSRMWVEHFGAPVDHIRMRTINGYLYTQVVPVAGKPGSSPPPTWLMRIMFTVLPPLRRRERTARRAFAERHDRAWLRRWEERGRPRIEAKLDAWFELDRSAMTDQELADHVREAVELWRETVNWTQMTDLAYLVPLSDLIAFLRSELGEDVDTAMALLAGSTRSAYQDSLSRLATLVTPAVEEAVGASTGVLERLEQLAPAFAEAYRAHRRAHGLRILGFDLTTPTLLEQPATELARIVGRPAIEGSSGDGPAAAEGVRTRLRPERRAMFHELLAEARSTFPIREAAEAVHARVMGAVRLAVLEAGRRMAAAGHVAHPEHGTFLTLDELIAWLGAPRDVHDIVRTRMGQHRWAMGHRPEPFMGERAALPEPKIFPPNIARLMAIFALLVRHDARPAELDRERDGVPASPGMASGPVRIVRGAHEFGMVRPGDVLVAPITTSSWEVLFPYLAALVTEGGGLLSHPAIVAREYGLPAVVGVEGATTRFSDGQVVTVNGSLGTVAPVEDQPGSMPHAMPRPIGRSTRSTPVGP